MTIPTQQRNGGAPPTLLRVEQAAECLNVSRATLYRLFEQDMIASIHIGRRRLVDTADLHRYVAGLKCEHPSLAASGIGRGLNG